MEEKHRPRVHVFGPFEQIARLCGLDLTYSIFRFQESKESGNVARAVISSASAILIILLILLKVVAVFQKEAKALSLEWAETNIDIGMILFGLASAICMSVWSHSRYVQKYQEKIDGLEQGPVRSDESFNKTHIKAFVMSAICMALVLGHSGKGIAYRTEINSTQEGNAFVLKLDNLWGCDPLIRGLAGLTSCIASVIFVISIHAVGRKIKLFNEDLKELVDQGGLQKIDNLVNMADRHTELMSLVKYTHSHISKFLTAGFVTSCVAHVNAVFVVMSYKSDLTTVYLVVIIGFLIVSGGFMGFTVFVPAKLQTKITDTIDILLYDKTIWQSQNEHVVSVARSMIDRARSDDLKMVLLGGFLLDSRLPHKLMLLIPNIGNVMTIIKRLM